MRAEIHGEIEAIVQLFAIGGNHDVAVWSIAKLEGSAFDRVLRHFSTR